MVNWLITVILITVIGLSGSLCVVAPYTLLCIAKRQYVTSYSRIQQLLHLDFGEQYSFYISEIDQRIQQIILFNNALNL